MTDEKSMPTAEERQQWRADAEREAARRPIGLPRADHRPNRMVALLDALDAAEERIDVLRDELGQAIRTRNEWEGNAEHAEAALDRVRALVSDWQANGNSRPLGDPTAATWHEAALQLLTALDGDRA